MTPGQPPAQDSGLPDALRAAVDRTLSILPAGPRRTGSAALDEIARRGAQARDELGRRLETLERRAKGKSED